MQLLESVIHILVSRGRYHITLREKMWIQIWNINKTTFINMYIYSKGRTFCNTSLQ